MNYRETPLLIPCHGDRMLGILSRPDGEQKEDGRIGVLIIVGGPQYRAGSHRQFTLLARHLAAHGIPAMRFDYRGMGDSEGVMRTFEEIDDDIRAALDAFFEAMPGMSHAVLWGLCDAASAALLYAREDARVAGLVLLNPWVHTKQAAAKTLLRHYYLQRLSQRAFWNKVIQGQFHPLHSLRALFGLISQMAGRPYASNTLETGSGGDRPPSTTTHAAWIKEQSSRNIEPISHNQRDSNQSLPARMLRGLKGFKGHVMLVLSGQDYTAKEFMDLVAADVVWQQALAEHSAHRVVVESADHVFSKKSWRDNVATETKRWLNHLP